MPVVAVIFVLSVVSSVLLQNGCDFSGWWCIPLTVGFYVAGNLLFLLFCYISSLCLPEEAKDLRERKRHRRMIRIAMKWMFALFLIRVELINADRLPREGTPYIIVSNHRSAFDPMSLLAIWKNLDLFFISKEDNFRLPIGGRYIRAAGFFAIDRENPMRAMRTIKAVGERMTAENGVVGIYPEGTRSRTGELLEFKEGAFLLAKRTGAPIAVIATEGSDRVFKRFPHLFARVTLTVLDVISPETVKAKSMSELAAMTRERIEAHLNASEK